MAKPNKRADIWHKPALLVYEVKLTRQQVRRRFYEQAMLDQVGSKLPRAARKRVARVKASQIWHVMRAAERGYIGD